MKRPLLIKIHLYLSGVCLFILALYATTGSLHLIGHNEREDFKVVQSLNVLTPPTKTDLENILSNSLKEIAPDYKFDYMKGSDTSLNTRPTSRLYYSIEFKQDSGEVLIMENRPNLNKSLMEFHKGHGPQKSRLFLGIIGIFAILALLTGLWLGVQVKVYRKTTLFTVGSGIIIFLILFNL